jgi:IPT/TIG domain-containing protein
MPSVSSFQPASGPIGTSVTINGQNLTGATAVKFHGTNAQSFTVNSSMRITAIVAAGTTTGTVSVTTPRGTATSAGTFTFLPPPSISSFDPTRGHVGDTVILMGSGFSGATAVAFNGTPAKKFTVKSSSKIKAIVRAGTTSGKVRVTGPNGTGTSAGTFTVLR